MTEPLALIGMIFTAVTVVGGIIVRDRQILNKITEGDEKLHSRINRAQSEFVRREELQAHLARLEQSVAQMHDEQRETNRRIDAILTRLGNK